MAQIHVTIGVTEALVSELHVLFGRVPAELDVGQVTKPAKREVNVI
jgi:hypothetical protein